MSSARVLQHGEGQQPTRSCFRLYTPGAEVRQEAVNGRRAKPSDGQRRVERVPSQDEAIGIRTVVVAS